MQIESHFRLPRPTKQKPRSSARRPGLFLWAYRTLVSRGTDTSQDTRHGPALPPLRLLASYWYFQTAPAGTSLFLRLLTSAHGAVAVLLFIGASLVGFTGRHGASLVPVFLWLQLLPLLLVALLLFRGPREIHLLLLPNIAGMLWAAFLGAMLVGGRWL